MVYNVRSKEFSVVKNSRVLNAYSQFKPLIMVFKGFFSRRKRLQSGNLSFSPWPTNQWFVKHSKHESLNADRSLQIFFQSSGNARYEARVIAVIISYSNNVDCAITSW